MRIIGRRSLLRTLCVAVAILVGTGAGAQEALQIGGRVSVATDRLNVRDAPSTAGAVIATLSTGAAGTIVRAAPVVSDGHRWWLVQFDTAAGGWVAEGTAKEPFIASAPPRTRRFPQRRTESRTQPCYASSGDHSCLIGQAEEMLYGSDAELMARRAAYYRAQLGDYARMWSLLNRPEAGEGYWRSLALEVSGNAAMEAGLSDWIAFNAVVNSAGGPTAWAIDYLLAKGELPEDHELATAPYYQRALGSEAWMAHSIGLSLQAALEAADTAAIAAYASKMTPEDVSRIASNAAEDLVRAGRYEDAVALVDTPGLFENVDSERALVLSRLLDERKFSYVDELLTRWPEQHRFLRRLAVMAVEAGLTQLALDYRFRVPEGERGNLDADLIITLGHAGRVAEAEGLFEASLAEAEDYFERFGNRMQNRHIGAIAAVYYLNDARKLGDALIASLGDADRSTLFDVATALAASKLPARTVRARLEGLIDFFGPDEVVFELLRAAISGGDETRVQELVKEFAPSDEVLEGVVRWDSGAWLPIVSPYFRSDAARVTLARELVISREDWEGQNHAWLNWILEDVPGLHLSSELRTLALANTGRLEDAYYEAKLITSSEDGRNTAGPTYLLIVAEAYRDAGDEERFWEIFDEAVTMAERDGRRSARFYLRAARLALGLKEYYGNNHGYDLIL